MAFLSNWHAMLPHVVDDVGSFGHEATMRDLVIKQARVPEPHTEKGQRLAWAEKGTLLRSAVALPLALMLTTMVANVRALDNVAIVRVCVACLAVRLEPNRHALKLLPLRKTFRQKRWSQR